MKALTCSSPAARRFRVWGVAAAVALPALVAGCGPPSADGRATSIVLILADTLRADYLGSYGFAGGISPHLDRLAAESVRFESCYSQAPWTKPSIASLFTSLHPQSHGVVTQRGAFLERSPDRDPGRPATEALPEEAATLAELLQAAGYATAGFVANPWIRRELGFAQGFEDFAESTDRRPPAADRLADAARDWLAERDGGRPFFLYLHLMDVHGPYDAPEEDHEAVRHSPSLDRRRELSERELRRLPQYLRTEPWTEGPGHRRLETWRSRYAAGVRALDRRLGPFLDHLRRSGLLDASLVVFTADHGEQLLEHGGWDHGFSLYDHDVRVPLLIRWPGGEAGGESRRAVVSLVDLMPTLLAAAGVEPPAGLAGRDLAGLARGAQPDAGAGEGAFFASVKWRPHLRGLRAGRYKLVTDLVSGSTRLFDLRADPGERRDLASEKPEVTSELRHRILSLEASLVEGPGLRPGAAAISSELEERLKALGYLD